MQSFDIVLWCRIVGGGWRGADSEWVFMGFRGVDFPEMARMPVGIPGTSLPDFSQF